MTETVAAGFLPPGAGSPDARMIDPDVVELSLLLPRWQAVALEDAAHQRGLSLGQMLRRMVSATLCGQTNPAAT